MVNWLECMRLIDVIYKNLYTVYLSDRYND